MNKYRFLYKFLKYKEPANTIKNINTIKNKSTLKMTKKNIDINDIDYSKNFWKNMNK